MYFKNQKGIAMVAELLIVGLTIGVITIVAIKVNASHASGWPFSFTLPTSSSTHTNSCKGTTVVNGKVITQTCNITNTGSQTINTGGQTQVGNSSSNTSSSSTTVNGITTCTKTVNGVTTTTTNTIGKC